MSNYIKELRKARGWTQSDLAERVNTSVQQISFLENGNRRLSQDWIRRISNALECHPLDITEGPAMPVEGKKRIITDELDGLSDGALTELRKYLDYLKMRDKGN
jgi:transcriptional regulator with XRE-family HTH domain